MTRGSEPDEQVRYTVLSVRTIAAWAAGIALRQKDRDQADVARAYALQERLAEQDRAHQLRVAAATEADAEARRS